MPKAACNRGFTLIELLIVMIILAILMAVAIPVFLGQKQKAIAVDAKNNAMLAFKTVESCAAGMEDGLYVEDPNRVGMADNFDCRNVPAVIDLEPGLKEYLTKFGAGRTCTAPDYAESDCGFVRGGVQVIPGVISGQSPILAQPSVDSFSIWSHTDTSPPVDFIIEKHADGTLIKRCQVGGSSPQPNLQRMCPTGEW